MLSCIMNGGEYFLIQISLNLNFVDGESIFDMNIVQMDFILIFKLSS
jgi:hypothetical protein